MQYQEAFMEYKDGLWNTKRLFWNTKNGMPNSFHVIPRSFFAIHRRLMEYKEANLEYQEVFMLWQEAPMVYPGALWNTKTLIEYHEARSNSKKLHGIPRSCPEIPRSSLEYQEADFDEVNRQTPTHIHTSRSFYEHQKAILEYHAFTECQEAFMQ